MVYNAEVGRQPTVLTGEEDVMKRFLILSISAVAAAALLTGCGAQGQAVDKDYMAKAEAKAGDIRVIFDKVGGNWDAMTAEDKAAYVANFKDEAEAKAAWDVMISPPPRGGMSSPAAGGAPR